MGPEMESIKTSPTDEIIYTRQFVTVSAFLLQDQLQRQLAQNNRCRKLTRGPASENHNIYEIIHVFSLCSIIQLATVCFYLP